MAAMLHLQAIRERLLLDPYIFDTIDDNIYPTHIIDVEDPVYPCITFYGSDGNRAIWSPQTTEILNLMFQFYSQESLEQCHLLYERYLAMLLDTGSKQMTGNSQVCFHELREIWSNTGVFDQATKVWVVSSRIIVRASLHG